MECGSKAVVFSVFLADKISSCLPWKLIFLALGFGSLISISAFCDMYIYGIHLNLKVFYQKKILCKLKLILFQ